MTAADRIDSAVAMTMATAVHRRQLQARARYRLESAMSRTGDGDICVPVAVMSALLVDAGLWRMAEHVDCYTERLKVVPALFVSALLQIGDERAERLRPRSGQKFSASHADFVPREFVTPNVHGEGMWRVDVDPVRTETPGGWQIAIGFPVLLVLSTVKEPGQFAERVAKALTREFAQ